MVRKANEAVKKTSKLEKSSSKKDGVKGEKKKTSKTTTSKTTTSKPISKIELDKTQKTFEEPPKVEETMQVNDTDTDMDN